MTPAFAAARPRISHCGGWARSVRLHKPDAELLIAAERLWRTIQGMLRMTVGRVEAAGSAASVGDAVAACSGGSRSARG